MFLLGNFPSSFTGQLAHQPLFHSKAMNVLMHPLSAREPIAPLDVEHFKAQVYLLVLVYIWMYLYICAYPEPYSRDLTRHGYDIVLVRV